MPRLPQGTETPSFDGPKFTDGPYILPIISVETVKFDWADLALRIKYGKTSEIPFDIERTFGIRYTTPDKKGSEFILAEVLAAAGVAISPTGDFNEQHLVGKSHLVYVYHNADGYAEIFNRVFPPSNDESYKARLTGMLQRAVKKGNVLLLGMTPKPKANRANDIDSPVAEAREASSLPTGDEEDLPF